ncbi:HipA family kinase [Serratia nematodiphila]|uniref:HipA family kinase n=1 Tax=Serratia nematodiphila TaxID=458197 RepID=UPI0011D459A9|nr:HipA family kinase [Serratia nematodiphila]TXE58167.1 hypothetical protein FOT58_19130 [Serratia nematodiphila]
MFEIMTSIRVGRLLPGFNDVGFGSRSPVRGTSQFSTGEQTVIAKRIPTREIAVELICSCIGREIGLPIPEPVLLADEDKNWYFGSVDVGHPNLMQVATASDTAIMSKLEQWPQLLQAACFDEWIANSDRGNENLLFDGSGFLLIDHGLAVPSGMSSNDWSDDYYNNQLLDVVMSSCERTEEKRTAIACSARDWSNNISDFDTAYDENAFPNIISAHHKSQVSVFLKDRISRLGDELYKKLNPLQGVLALND